MNNVTTATKHWSEPPDWVIELAKLCDEYSQAKAARAIGYSGAVVNQILRNSYAGQIDNVEHAVRGALMNLCVNCPVLGEIATHSCMQYQRRRFAPTNSMRVRLYRACRNGCAHYRGQS